MDEDNKFVDDSINSSQDERQSENAGRIPPPPPPIRPRPEFTEGPHPDSPAGEEGPRADFAPDFSSAAPSAQSVPPPPAPEIAMRTMEGDIRSIQGGAPTPVPESVLPSELKDVLEQPETVDQMAGPVEAPATRKVWKTILVLFLIVVIGGGLGWAGYKYVYPLFIPVPEEGPPKMPTGTQPSLQTRITHKTYFVGTVSKTTINFRDLGLPNILQALRQVPVEQNQTFKEVEIFDVTGGQIYAKDFLSNVLPLTDADKTLLADSLEPDFTSYLYYDKDTAWPGYVFKIKSASSVSALRQSFLPIVELVDLSAFYLVPPGTFQPFKDGKVGNYSTRYAVGSQSGAAFNHGILGDYLIFSTSYDGLKAAVAALGL